MATWQAAQPGTIIGDGQGNYQMRVGGQWTPMPKGSLAADEHGAYHFDADAIQPPKYTPNPVDVANAEADKNEHGPVQDVIDMVKSGVTHIPQALKGLLDSVKGPMPHNPDIATNAQSFANIPEAVSRIPDALQSATPETVGANVVAPLLAGGLAGKAGSLVAGAAAPSAAAAAEAATPAARLGLRTAENAPIARSIAGPSGREALILQNNPVGKAVAGAEAGVPHGTDVTYDTLEKARGVSDPNHPEYNPAAPNAVYGRVASNLPTAPLSERAATAVRSAGGADRITEGTPDAITNIQALKDQLLASGRSFTGDQVINESRGLRQEGGTNIASDDVSKQQLGKAQLDMAKALEQHIEDTLPPNAEVSLEQFQNARTALAKNFTVQSALNGKYIDLPALARIQRSDPNVLTGNLRVLADFANDHPEVSMMPGAGTRYAPPGLGKDLGHINLLNPRSWVQPLVGSAARRSLTGDPAAALEAARTAPVTGLGGEFEPLPLTSLHTPGEVGPPPGRQVPLPLGPEPRPPSLLPAVADLHNPPGPTPAPAAPPGQIPLADLLSHGVEQSPAPGLSAGPMGAPAPVGIPFAGSPEAVGAKIVKGGRPRTGPGARPEINGEPVEQPTPEPVPGIPLGDRFATSPSGSNSDLPGVRMQGVPEDIVQRAAPTGPRPKVAHSPAFITDNASGESPASLEAQSRVKEGLAKGVQPIAFGADDVARPMSPHDVERADLRPAPNEIFINAKDGSIINSGNMAPRLAQSMLARWKALHGSNLGNAF